MELNDNYDYWLSECALIEDGDTYFCGHAGSEPCSFECPFSHMIGSHVPQDDEPLDIWEHTGGGDDA